MTIKRIMYCDKCGRSVSISGSPSMELFRKMMRKDGWSCGKRDLCPYCKKVKNKKL